MYSFRLPNPGCRGVKEGTDQFFTVVHFTVYYALRLTRKRVRVFLEQQVPKFSAVAVLAEGTHLRDAVVFCLCVCVCG